MTDRLTSSTLDQPPTGISLPGYDRQSQRAGIVHLGVGAFHRGHQAAYFDQLMALGEEGWAIQGASLRSARVAEQLNPQRGLYTLIERDGPESKSHIVGSIQEILVAPENPKVLVDKLAHADTQLVTMTVTEKGYCIDPASGNLRDDDPDVIADLEDLSAPRTTPGFLLAGFKARKEAGLKPFTVLSCDNIPENGVRTRNAVLAMARRIDGALADWIESEGAFPSSMVDRIVPATTDEDIAELARSAGYRDEAMVKTEPFTQWVVEDNFCADRPPLEKVGVQMTNDVVPWETSKLRMLNGAHSAIAYLGGLAGAPFVHDAMAIDAIAQLVDRIWDESGETLPPIPELDVTAYRARLKARFENSALQHRTHQIAMDGSQKLPQRLLTPLLERHDRQKLSPALSLAIAAWLRWQHGVDENGEAFAVDDPLSETTRSIVEKHGGDHANYVGEMLGLSEVFSPRFIHDDILRKRILESYICLTDAGVEAACLAALTEG